MSALAWIALGVFGALVVVVVIVVYALCVLAGQLDDLDEEFRGIRRS